MFKVLKWLVINSCITVSYFMATWGEMVPLVGIIKLLLVINGLASAMLLAASVASNKFSEQLGNAVKKPRHGPGVYWLFPTLDTLIFASYGWVWWAGLYLTSSFFIFVAFNCWKKDAQHQ